MQAVRRLVRQESEDVARLKRELEAELDALRDVRNWLQRWYRHKDGGLKKQSLALAVAVSTAGLLFWYFSKTSSTPVGRCLQRALDWWQEWRDHASAVTDDMAIMGPFIHMAATLVRTVNESEVVKLSSDAVAHKQPRIEYMAM